jgi:hypothetical protein
MLYICIYIYLIRCLQRRCFLRVLIEQWIRAKYEREEFCHPERQNHYVSGFMEGFLMKRGKEDARYHPRKFVLSEGDDTLKYYVKENKVKCFQCLSLLLAAISSFCIK